MNGMAQFRNESRVCEHVSAGLDTTPRDVLIKILRTRTRNPSRVVIYENFIYLPSAFKNLDLDAKLSE